ncbi:MAG: 5'-flap endonuclease [Geoglossum simile]|nr:MAG: 5'-flap endonuclease [Geoglossum simile]
MAASLVILSSSPPRPGIEPVSASSSPGLPSPSQLMRQARLVGSPRPSLLPPSAIAEFKSAAELLRDEGTQPGCRRRPKAMEMTAQAVANGEPVGKGRKATNKGAGPKKVEKQGRIKPMKITKAVRGIATDTLDGKPHISKNGLTALSTPPGTKSGAPGESNNDGHDLLLDPVVRRRVSWTPPKNTIPTVDLSMTPGDRSEEPTAVEHPQRCFRDLLDNFVNERGRPSTGVTAVPVRIPVSTRKRQRTEFMDPISVLGPINGNESTDNIVHDETALVEITAREATSMLTGKTGEEQAYTMEVIKKKTTARKPPIDKTQKERAPRKKPKTITEQATRPYNMHPASPAPILKFLAQQTTKTDSSKGVGVAAGQATPPKRPRKAKPVQASNGTPKASRRKKPKESGPPQTLLSPRSAFKKMDEQVVWFGTSSQLVREGSPSHVSQPANPPDQVISQLGSAETTGLTGGVPRKHIIPYASTAGGLWSAASGELDGSLIEVDVIDLATTPRTHNFPRETNKVPVSVIPGQKPQTANIPLGLGDAGCVGVASGLRPSFACSDSSTSVDEPTRVNLLKSKPSQALSKQSEKSSSTTAADTPPLLGQSYQVKPTNVRPPKPDLAGYTTAQLNSAIVSYGFKPIKSRNRMIALLEKCWEVKNRVALQTVEPSGITPVSGVVGDRGSVPVGGRGLVTGGFSAPTKAIQTAPVVRDATVPKKPRGRPKKPSPASASTGGSLEEGPPKSPECGPTGGLLTATGNVASEDVDIATLGVVSPKRPRGRPRKSVTLEASAPPREQVVGQGVDATSATKVAIQGVSPNRRSGLGANGLSREAIPSVPGTSRTTDLSLAMSMELTPALSDEAKQQRTFDRISRAISSQPPPENACLMPNFHQKILMYDPIVLEDLTAWLNTKGLAGIGVDAEVGVKEVRAWCERNSICCLWKGGLWGRSRSRH